MAEDTAGLGEALALGTNAQTSYHGTPLQHAVQTGIQSQMRRDLSKQKQDAEEQKRRKTAEEKITRLSGGVYNERYRPLSEQIAHNYYTGAIGKPFAQQQEMFTNTMNYLNYLAEKSKQDEKVFQMHKMGYIVPKNVVEALRSGDDTKIEKAAQGNVLYPFIGVNKDEHTGKYDVYASDYTPKYNSRLDQDIEGAFNNEFTKVQETFGKSVGKNRFETQKKLTDDITDNLAVRFADNHNDLFTIINNNEGEATRLMNDKISKDPTLTEDPAKYMGALEQVGADLFKEKFKQHAQTKYSVRGEYQQPKSDVINIGGGYNVSGNIFNPTDEKSADNLSLLDQAGVVHVQNPQKNKDFFVSWPTLPSIASPNKGKYQLTDQHGSPVVMDNVTMVYVPKMGNGGGKWFVKGFTKDRLGSDVVKNIPINEKTYGSVISIYPKMTKDGLEKMLNARMKDGGITNDVFKLSVNKPQASKANKSVGKINKPKKVENKHGI